MSLSKDSSGSNSETNRTPIIQQATTFIAKYKMDARKLGIMHCGVHISNRGPNTHIYPNEKDVKTLALNIHGQPFYARNCDQHEEWPASDRTVATAINMKIGLLEAHKTHRPQPSDGHA